MNINELKSRLQSLNHKGEKGNDVWKPKSKHDVRLLPYKHGDDPFIERYFHYEIGDAGAILCPKMNFNEDCVICDFCNKLKAWKDPEGKDKPENVKKGDWEVFKKIQPKVRIFIPMCERGKESEGPKFWGVSPTQAQTILEICTEGERLGALGIKTDDAKGAINVVFGLDKAFDLQVTSDKPGENGNTKTYNNVTIKGKITPTPFMSSKKSTDEFLAKMKNMDAVYPKMSSADVEKAFKRFIGDNSSEAKAEGGTEKYEAKPAANTKENAAKVGGRSIDDAFGDMLAEDEK